MSALRESLTAWIRDAETNLADRGVTEADLSTLRELAKRATPRQRLLYLQTKTPSVTAAVIGMAQHEPVAGGADTLRTRDEWPYASVHEAIVDGWQVIQFPDLMAPYDDRELSYVGYEFVLQKIEEVINE